MRDHNLMMIIKGNLVRSLTRLCLMLYNASEKMLGLLNLELEFFYARKVFVKCLTHILGSFSSK